MKPKCQSMVLEADMVATGADLVIEQYENGNPIRRATVRLETHTAEYIAEHCLRWMVRRRNEAQDALDGMKTIVEGR